MAPSSVNLLREWSCSSPTEKNTDSPEDAPVIATLVANSIPRIYRQGNVLFQNAYGQFGQHFSFGSSDQVLKSLPSAEHSFDLEMKPSYSSWVYEDHEDEGEVHFINGEAVVVSVVDDDDDLYEQAYQNRRRPPRNSRSHDETPVNRLRKFLDRGKVKQNKSNGRRGRKGSKDKKIRWKNQNEIKPDKMFPVVMEDDDKKPKRWNRKNKMKTTINLKRGQERLNDSISVASRKDKMSTAAIEFMKEAKIVPDCEISELNTDCNSFTDTDFNIANSPPRDSTQSSFQHEKRVSSFNGESWLNFVEEIKVLLDGNANHAETRVSTGCSEEGSHIQTQSLPNVFPSTSPFPILEGTEAANFGKRVKEYESRLEQINLSSQLHIPVSPRKPHRRQNSQNSIGINSPPQCMFDKSQYRRALKCVSCDPIVEHSIPGDGYNNTLKVVFVGSPDVGKTSLMNALTQKHKKQRTYKKSVGINVETWNPTTATGDRDVKFNLWDLQGGNLEIGAHHVSYSSVY